MSRIFLLKYSEFCQLTISLIGTLMSNGGRKIWVKDGENISTRYY